MLCHCGTETVKRANWKGVMCDFCPKCKKFGNFALIVGRAA